MEKEIGAKRCIQPGGVRRNYVLSAPNQVSQLWELGCRCRPVDDDRSFDVVDPETCVTMVTDEPAALLLSFKAVGSSRQFG